MDKIIELAGSMQLNELRGCDNYIAYDSGPDEAVLIGDKSSMYLLAVFILQCVGNSSDDINTFYDLKDFFDEFSQVWPVSLVIANTGEEARKFARAITE